MSNNYYWKLALIIAVIALLAGATKTQAAQINGIAGAYTYHFERGKKTEDGRDLNEHNLMLGVQYDNYTALYFKNSYYNNTYALGYHFNTNITKDINVGMLVGAMHGYTQDEINSLCFGNICGLVAPTIKYTHWSWQPTMIVTPEFVSFAIVKEF